MFETIPIIKSLLRNKTGPILIIIQLAITIAIVSNALFFINQRVEKINRPTGIANEEIVRTWVKANHADADMEYIIKRDLAHIRAMEGVIDATVISAVPLSNSGSASGFQIEPGEDQEDIPANYYQMDEHGINTLGMKLIDGRNFTVGEVEFRKRTDIPKNINAIATKKLADKLFPGESALGKTIYDGRLEIHIIGIVESMLGAWLNWEHTGNALFYPGETLTDSTNYLIRTHKDETEKVMLSVVESLRALDSTRLIVDEKTIETVLKESYSNDYAMIKILSVVVGMLILVNALGIIGLTTFWVNQRRKQIGVRRALGANRLAISRYFILENMILCLVAAAAGSMLAFAASDMMVRRYSVDLLDWPFVPFTGLCILLLTIVAASVPAWQASKISPAEATASV